MDERHPLSACAGDDPDATGDITSPLTSLRPIYPVAVRRKHDHDRRIGKNHEGTPIVLGALERVAGSSRDGGGDEKESEHGPSRHRQTNLAETHLASPILRRNPGTESLVAVQWQRIRQWPLPLPLPPLPLPLPLLLPPPPPWSYHGSISSEHLLRNEQLVPSKQVAVLISPQLAESFGVPLKMFS